MAAILESLSGQTGLSLYVHIRDSAGSVWNGSSFVSWNVSNWATYALAMTEQTSSGYYNVAMPSAIAAGKYSYFVYQKLGGTAAVGDTAMGASQIYWTGSYENDLNSFSPGQEADIATQIANALNTAIPGSPTANSIFERVKAIDDKLPTGTISDFDETANNVNLGASQTGVTIGTVNALGSTAQSQVNDQVLDVLATDTVSELSAIPAATPTMRQILMLLYMAIRNKRTASTSEEKIHTASGTAIATATVSDSGTIFTKENFS
jgi:hypothetical protein